MTKILALFLLMAWPTDINDISKVNSLKKKAAAAFNRGNFEQAAEHYSYLLDTMRINDESAMMNLANSYYQTGKPELAQNQYAKLTLSENQELKSAAYQQLGALSKDPKTLEKALSYFKESIKSDPSNEDSRYNYELVKKKLKEQQNQQQQDQNQQNEDQNEDQDQKDQKNEDQDKQNKDQQKDQEQQDEQNKDQQNQEQQEQEQKDQQDQQQQENKDQEGKEDEQRQNQEQQEQEGKEGEEQEQEKTPQQQTADKLKEMNISEEKAKMILEALKNNEVQYIQQNRRKPTKKKESGKPDW